MASPQKSSGSFDCKTCYTKYTPSAGHLTFAECDHGPICQACINKAFATSVRDGRGSVPECCAGRPMYSTEAQERLVLGLVAGPLRHAFDAASRAARLVTYRCADTGCAAVFSGDPVGGSVRCTACGTPTCARCGVDARGRRHDCAAAAAGYAAELARLNGGRACPRCGRVAGKKAADDKMVACCCGAVFCFRCGQDVADPEYDSALCLNDEDDIGTGGDEFGSLLSELRAEQDLHRLREPGRVCRPVEESGFTPAMEEEALEQSWELLSGTGVIRAQ